ncbi:hypothetical protein C9I49_07315 [Pseudomonas prosekii]|uniref:Uncharacterized protein n=1 Tax=Pseudomonas prosekii TaxID=1148509 RepID=A0A2U2DBQ4_9PSED|nr:hypothetical protein C9I49_07315 [Pseudomonas prosekii]
MMMSGFLLPTRCTKPCSSCRACEAAFGCAAVVIVLRDYDDFVAERSLAGSAAATDFDGVRRGLSALHLCAATPRLRPSRPSTA